MTDPVDGAIPVVGSQRVNDTTDFRSIPMLTTILVLLIVLWLMGMVSSYTIGGFIHILLVIAIALVLIRVIQGRRPV